MILRSYARTTRELDNPPFGGINQSKQRYQNEWHMTQLKLDVEEALPSTVSKSTAQYNIFISCNKCAGMHETGISITVEDGPREKQSIGNFYSGKNLPKTLATLSNQSFPCPLTGRQFIQKDTKQIFLIPVKGLTENDSRRNRKAHG